MTISFEQFHKAQAQRERADVAAAANRRIVTALQRRGFAVGAGVIQTPAGAFRHVRVIRRAA